MRRPGFLQKDDEIQRPGFIEHKSPFQRPGLEGIIPPSKPAERLRSAVQYLSQKYLNKFGIHTINGQWTKVNNISQAKIIVRVIGDTAPAKAALPSKVWGIPIIIQN